MMMRENIMNIVADKRITNSPTPATKPDDAYASRMNE